MRQLVALHKTVAIFLRHASNELGSFVLVQVQHCQAGSPPIDTFLTESLR